VTVTRNSPVSGSSHTSASPSESLSFMPPPIGDHFSERSPSARISNSGSGVPNQKSGSALSASSTIEIRHRRTPTPCP
jgi:hypothetical protein